MSGHLIEEQRDAVVIRTLGRLAWPNALTPDLIRDLHGGPKAAFSDRRLAGIVITGSPPGSSAGQANLPLG